MKVFALPLLNQINGGIMEIDDLQDICKKLPGVTEDIKWGHDLCFLVGEKMFCVVGLDQKPVSSSFKVRDDEFAEMSARAGFKPAPYVAKYKWVWTNDINNMSKKDWKHYATQSYELVKNKLPKKLRQKIDGNKM
jgi:predicted DNA-binding protein (MmcQ/YjbR family)